MKKKAINSRSLQKRIKILGTTIVPDGFGGNISSLSEIASRWASVEDLSTGANVQRTINIGLTDFTGTFKFVFRYDEGLTLDAKLNALQYKGLNYTILNITTEGFNKVKQVVIARQNTNG